MNILAIGAHYDDLELGCGGTLAKYVLNGHNVTGVVVTHSKYSDYNGELIRARETARREGTEAAHIVGYDLLCLEWETKKVAFGHELIETLNRIIDEREIDVIFTHWDFDVHQDHQAIGKATLSAGRKINRLLMYRSNLYMNSIHFNENYFVDITETIEIKMRAIEAHRNEVKKFGPHWVQFWRNEAANNGQKVGVRYAEVFQLVKYLA
ncbi:MAG: hypothetical protein D6679_10170 [Candidatus Hydrogenedentota bacterium]|nr:MAG: hypothetical protein D6679_10170 [Candidatus Hydrogenedentota bacterium]